VYEGVRNIARECAVTDWTELAKDHGWNEHASKPTVSCEDEIQVKGTLIKGP